MQKQKYTIVIFPGNTDKPKKFQVSETVVKGFLGTLITFAIILAGSSYYLSSGFLRIKNETIELTDLRREAKLQKTQVEQFSQRIKNFETEMTRLSQFEKKLRIITALENSPKSLKKNWGVGGPYGLNSYSFETSLAKETGALISRLSQDLSMLNNQAKVQTISLQEIDEHFKNQTSLLSAIPSVWPTRGWVTSGFGFRKSPFTGLREKHEGLDIAARTGSTVRSPADGLVVVAGREYGYGNMVEIDHGYGFKTRYGHNSKHLVKVGDRVKRGQVVALVGNTGRSTGPHLHYEIMFNRIPVNPKNYILED